MYYIIEKNLIVNNMEKYLYISQVVISILLIIVVLVQNRSSGLSSTFGGEGMGNFYASKRGIEKILSRSTVILAILFLLNAAMFLFLPYLT